MVQFEVTYEDVAFTTGNDHVGLPVDVVDEMNTTLSFPKGFLKLLEATSSVDDSVYRDGKDESGSVKLFVVTRFLVEANDEDAAEALPVPTALLEEIADAMSIGVDMEGNWEFSDVQPAEDALAPGL